MLNEGKWFEPKMEHSILGLKWKSSLPVCQFSPRITLKMKKAKVSSLHFHSFSLSPSLIHSHSLVVSLSLALSLFLSLSLTVSLSVSLSLTHTVSLSLIFSISLSLSHFLSLSLSFSLSLSLSLSQRKWVTIKCDFSTINPVNTRPDK